MVSIRFQFLTYRCPTPHPHYLFVPCLIIFQIISLGLFFVSCTSSSFSSSIIYTWLDFVVIVPFLAQIRDLVLVPLFSVLYTNSWRSLILEFLRDLNPCPPLSLIP